MSPALGFRVPLRDRILRNSDVRGPEECWEWRASCNEQGYGIMSRPGRENGAMRAHRVSYEVFVGPIPEGLTLDHTCRNRACVNPNHLEPVTLAENVMRGEGPCARFARQTHCKRGHEFTPENTYLYGTGRFCRTCRREYDRIRRKAVV